MWQGMTAEEFEAKVGRPPEDDDLERVNCPRAGEVGHWSCGWCAAHDGPMFECQCSIRATRYGPPETTIDVG